MGSVTETTAVVRELRSRRDRRRCGSSSSTRRRRAVDGHERTFDARPGGAVPLSTVVPGHVAVGEFVEVDPPRRLVFTWGWEPSGEGKSIDVAARVSTIEIELEPSGEGTRSALHAPRPPQRGGGGSHAHGWDHYSRGS